MSAVKGPKSKKSEMDSLKGSIATQKDTFRMFRYRLFGPISPNVSMRRKNDAIRKNMFVTWCPMKRLRSNLNANRVSAFSYIMREKSVGRILFSNKLLLSFLSENFGLLVSIMNLKFNLYSKIRDFRKFI